MISSSPLIRPPWSAADSSGFSLSWSSVLPSSSSQSATWDLGALVGTLRWAYVRWWTKMLLEPSKEQPRWRAAGIPRVWHQALWYIWWESPFHSSSFFSAILLLRSSSFGKRWGHSHKEIEMHNYRKFMAHLYLLQSSPFQLDLMVIHVMTIIWYIFRNTPRRTKQWSWFSPLPTLFSSFLPLSPFSLLSLVYRLAFTSKVFNFHEWQLLQIDVFWYLVFYSWYWWMYAVNVFIYMITDQGFRDVYQLFLKDVTGCFNG